MCTASHWPCWDDRRCAIAERWGPRSVSSGVGSVRRCALNRYAPPITQHRTRTANRIRSAARQCEGGLTLGRMGWLSGLEVMTLPRSGGPQELEAKAVERLQDRRGVEHGQQAAALVGHEAGDLRRLAA